MKPACAPFWLFWLLAGPGVAAAQPALRAGPPVAWLRASTEQRLRGPWGVFSEVEVRQANGQLPAQALGRLALRWHAGRSFSLSTGYVLARNQAPHDPETTLPEHRFYQELALADASGPVRASHRLRAEERWLRPAPGTAFAFVPRLRYQLRLVVPLHRGGRLPVGSAYLLAADELFFGLGPRTRVLEENRLLGGLGYRLAPGTALEIAYLWQTQAAGAIGYEAARRQAVQVAVCTGW